MLLVIIIFTSLHKHTQKYTLLGALFFFVLQGVWQMCGIWQAGGHLWGLFLGRWCRSKLVQCRDCSISLGNVHGWFTPLVSCFRLEWNDLHCDKLKIQHNKVAISYFVNERWLLRLERSFFFFYKPQSASSFLELSFLFFFPPFGNQLFLAGLVTDQCKLFTSWLLSTLPILSSAVLSRSCSTSIDPISKWFALVFAFFWAFTDAVCILESHSCLPQVGNS